MVSIRTIRYSISRIKTYLEKYNCVLNYSNRKGYYFNKQDLIKVQILLEEMTADKGIATNKHQRKIYLSGRIIRKECVEIDKLADQLFISTASVLSDAESVSSKYHGIEISSNKIYNKMTIEQKLRLVTNLVIEESQKSKVLSAAHIKFFFDNKIENFKQIEKCIKLSSIVVPNKMVQFQISWLLLYITEEFEISLDTNESILTKLNTCLTTDEYSIILKYLRILGAICGEKVINLDVRKFLGELEKYYNYKMNNEFEIVRLEHKVASINDQISEQIIFKFAHTKRYIRLYPYSFSISQQLLNSTLGKQSYSRDQVAYISDSIQKILFESVNSKTILFIVDGDEAVANSYTEWILSKYTKNVLIQIEQYNNYQQGIDIHGNNIACIINCTELEVVTSYDVLSVGSSLSIESLNKIDKMLSVENGNYKFFQHFLSQRLLKVYLTETSFDQVLKNSSNNLMKNKYITDADSYFKDCQEREKVGTTYIGYKTMISHPLVHRANENILFITVLSEPVLVEGDEVQLIINCAFKNEIEFDISRLFELIMKMIETEKSIGQITSSKSEMELLINIRNAVIKI
ncbi:MAG: PTS sugar transporter subunit IIA [Coprobacillaceae bacterium]